MSNLNNFVLNKLKINFTPNLLALPMQGTLTGDSKNYYYLKIDNQFIHILHAILNRPDVSKPNYCDENGLGAHISVIYPEENVLIDSEEIGHVHSFTLGQCYSAQLDTKEYFIITIDAPSLLLLRKKYHLPELLNFKGHGVVLHATFGVRLVTN